MSRGDALTILPLGGLGEIGMNMTLYGVGDDWFAVDAGVQFCDPWLVGAEHCLPDLDLLSDYRDRIQAVVLTHGHEDHLGAVEHVARVCRVPVYAPAFACELLRLKADEFGAVARPDLHPVTPGDRVSVGPMTIEFLRVTHSIPDCHALAIRTPFGTVVHSGDFKVDPDPPDGRPFDHKGFERLGDKGVRLLLSDSTNALAPGRTRPEREVIAGLAPLIEEAPGRVIVSLFASNVHRVLGLVEVAARAGRRVALVGRSLHVYLEAARRAGQVTGTAKGVDFVDTRALDLVPDGRLLVICTGSQAEARSALYRAAQQDHPDLVIRPGDLVILSSRIIPGNERAIHRMINNLTRLGARVLHERVARVHGSGHACQEELKDLIRLVRPRSFIPIHGEYSFLRAHADLALQEGVPDCRVVENGHLVEVTADEVSVADRLPLTFHYVDGPLVGDASELRLDERRRIGWTGVLAARVVMRSARVGAGRGSKGGGGHSKKPWRALVEVQGVGVPIVDPAQFETAAAEVVEELEDLPAEATRAQMEETVSGTLRAFFRRRMERKPHVMVFLNLSD